MEYWNVDRQFDSSRVMNSLRTWRLPDLRADALRQVGLRLLRLFSKK